MKDEQAVIECDTTKGSFQMRFYRAWSPNGYDRAVELYEKGFFDESHFFRAIPGFLVQFGITYSTDPSLRLLMDQNIEDDPPLDPPIEFEEGVVSYAGNGENSRSSQMFIAYGKNKHLGEYPWETPFGVVERGMENVKKFYSYGDEPPDGDGPEQDKIYNGPRYIEEHFPLLDKFKSCSVEIFRHGQAGYAVDRFAEREAPINTEEKEDELEEESGDIGRKSEEARMDDDDDDDELLSNKANKKEEERNAGEMSNLRHRLQHRLVLKGLHHAIETGNKAYPLSPGAGLALLGAIALLVCILRSFVQPSPRKLSQKKN
ncbi:hypothetical protein ACA910_005555 [Epithemia clementina (nom. ined.)]